MAAKFELRGAAMGNGHGVDLERLAAASQEIIGCVPQPKQTDLESIIGDSEW